MHGIEADVKDTVVVVEAHHRGLRNFVRKGGTNGLIVKEEEDGAGGTYSEGKKMNRGKHEVGGGRSGPEMPIRSSEGSPKRSERLSNKGSG